MCDEQLREKEKEEWVETYTIHRWRWNGRLAFRYEGIINSEQKEKPESMQVFVVHRDSEGTRYSADFGGAIPAKIWPLFSEKNKNEKFSDPDFHVQEMLRLNPGRWDEFGAQDGLNRWLIARVIDRIRKEPLLYDQTAWGQVKLPEDIERSQKGEIAVDQVRSRFGSYETPACVLGHGFAEMGIMLQRDRMSNFDIIRIGAELFGLTIPQAQMLFCSKWSSEWFREESLTMEPEGLGYGVPDNEEAVMVLERLVQYGFAEE